MVIKDVIVYEIQPLVDSKDLYNVSTISTDAFDKKAFRVNDLIFLPHTMPKFGDMFEIKDGKTWSLKSNYQIHNYELATVIGRQGNDLLVYGDKIGEQIIQHYPSAHLHANNATFDIQRGDDLLLKEYARNKFTIIHNITQSQIKHQRDLRTK